MKNVVKPRRAARLNLRPSHLLSQGALHVVVAVFLVVWFTPILGLFLTSLRPQAEMATSGWWRLFVAPIMTGYNYQQAIRYVGVGDAAATSLAIAIPVTAMTTLISAIGAYVLTRMEFPGRKALSLALVAMLVIPPQVTIVPLLKLFVLLHLNGTVATVWVYQVGFTVPFGIFLIRGFIASIPEDLFESASIDGASTLVVFRSIVLPLCAPILASLAILQFLWSWNDLLIPLIFLGGSQLAAPITVQAAGIATTNGQDQTVLMAATFLSVLLPLVILVSMQKFFVRGILGGAVKG
jgi:alpha-glucoside transport system permease protein